ncbi:class I SAM-dependent methyltransferase [Zhihengliuella salsuginis]|uniref:Methyltransferase n=1 Tax=Zhihengliuella salsuginis TaxID=578222 RepID=A0ABQ3GHH7_9MICC|nr:class I SAM-dependent methyltransferase [Zhihengliuella salsuginis]GHD05109.1 methyltransferase [Zhihengliuella salsuginis]
MGLYGEHILPRLMARSMEAEEIAPLRRRLCAGLSGRVLELGFGSGANIRHYPEAVDSVWAVEPSDTAWRLAADKIAASRVRIQRGGLDGQRLDAPAAAFDHALSSLTLCTIPDAAAALAEVRRVLAPGGTLHFLEHGLAPDEGVRVWQRRLDPIQRSLAGGCRLSRDIRELIEAAGFGIVEAESFYQPPLPRPYGYVTVGVAAA